MISAFVITRSSVMASGRPVALPIPSRMTLPAEKYRVVSSITNREQASKRHSPPPNLSSSPYDVKSRSTSTHKSVSPNLTKSPVVGPYILAYVSRLSSHAFASSTSPCSRCSNPRSRILLMTFSRSPTPCSSCHEVFTSKFPPETILCPAISTSETVLLSPGSNRTAVPGAMSRRRKSASSRSKRRALFVSEKW